MQILKKSDSKLLDRSYLEVLIEGKAGSLSRKDAISMVAEEMKVGPEKVGLLGLEQRSGSMDIWGKFFVYGSEGSRDRLHPKHLGVRLLTKEEKEKLKQEKKKAATAAPAPEAKK